MTQEDWTKMNEISHYKSLIKQDIEHRKLIKRLQREKEDLKKQLELCNISTKRSEQLLALAQYMCQHQNNLDGKTAKDYLQEFLSQ